MKKIIKKENKKIERQILKGNLAVAALTVIMLAVISVIGLKKVQKEIVLSDSKIIEEIAEDEVANVLKSILSEMAGVCENLSLNCAEKINKYIEELKICSDAVRDVYENPDNYGSREIGIPSEELRDKLCLYFSLNKDMDYESKKNEINKIGCVWQVFQSVYENSRLNSIYYTTKDGILFSFDENSGEVLDKLEEGQSTLYLQDYEPREMEWYKNSCMDEKGSVRFSGTYLDSTGNLVVTCSQPVYKEDEYMGVMAIDIYLGNVEDELIGTDDIKYDGFVEIADGSGNVIVSPSLKDNKEKYRHINILTDEEEGLTELAEDMLSGETAIKEFIYKGQESYGVYMPVEYTGWSIAVVFNTDMVLDDIYERYNYIMEANAATEKSVENIIEDIMVFFFGGALVIMAAGALLSRLVSRRITRPIGALIKDVNVISGGNLDYRVSINTGNELQELGDAFNKMTLSLREHMDNLKRVTADKERISTELDVASQIQLSLLPEQIPSSGNGFDVCAFMKPAKEVGGDFYDYFMTDDNHLWLVAADVSGKGIPASLFMMMGKTLIKNMAKTIGTPAEILKSANSQLNEHNDAMMFITCFVCVIELSSGRMTFANGGHNFPFYCTEGSEYIKVENTPDLPLAVLEDTDYKNHYMDLKEGDRFFLYTDGVTEAMDEKGVLYGEERLQKVLGEVSENNRGAYGILQTVREDIRRFSKNAEQADDITMVAFVYTGKKEKSITAKAGLGELSRIIEFVEKSLNSGGFDREFITTMKFIADELFSNIALYAYDELGSATDVSGGALDVSGICMEDNVKNDGRGKVVITVNVCGKERAELIFEDWGKPYNPLEKEAPDVTLSGEEREEGGLGIYLVRSMSDGMEYERKEGKNVLRVWKKA